MRWAWQRKLSREAGEGGAVSGICLPSTPTPPPSGSCVQGEEPLSPPGLREPWGLQT